MSAPLPTTPARARATRRLGFAALSLATIATLAACSSTSGTNAGPTSSAAGSSSSTTDPRAATTAGTNPTGTAAPAQGTATGAPRPSAGCTPGSATTTAPAPTTTPPTNPKTGSTVPPGAPPISQADADTADLGEVVTMVSSGMPRWYLRHDAKGHEAGTPIPMVLDLHGYAEGAVFHHGVSNLGQLGNEEGFAVIAPQGQGTPAHWNTTVGSDDLTFIGEVLDDAEANLCVDLSRVYVTGFSNGAFLTSAIACQYADRFAAAAPVAGIRDVPDCKPANPVPVIAFHGTDDTFVVYNGGMGEGAKKLPAPDGSGNSIQDASSANGAVVPGSMDQKVPDNAAAWAKRNGCETTPKESEASSDTTLITFDCPSGAEVQLYRTQGAGHEWPGSPGSVAIASVVGKTTMTIDATKLMWAFFEAHQLPS